MSDMNELIETIKKLTQAVENLNVHDDTHSKCDVDKCVKKKVLEYTKHNYIDCSYLYTIERWHRLKKLYDYE